MTPLTAGRVARRLLAFYRNDPKRWTQNHVARTKTGNYVSATHPAAVCWCAVGAIDSILKVNESSLRDQRAWEAITVLRKALSSPISLFNDSCPDFTTFQDSLKKIARLP